MKKLTQTTLSIIAVLFVSLAFVQCQGTKDSAITKFMELQAEQVNKQCPMNMGNGLTLDECKIDGNKTFKYSFTVTDEVASQLKITDEMKPMVVQAIKALPEFKQIEQFEISFIYAYYDASKKLLGEIKISPEDYK